MERTHYKIILTLFWGDKVKKSKKNINQIKKIVLLAFIIGIVVYFLYNIYFLVKQPTNSFVIEKGKIYSEEETEGYIIRNETVISGQNYKNGIVQIKTEGKKVAKGDSVFRYYSKNENDLNKKIEELDIKIQQAMDEQTDIYSSDIKLLEEQIDNILDKISNTNNMEEIVEYRQQINEIVTKKAKIAGDLSPAGSYIKKLIEERSSYEKELNSGAEYITAPISGIVSYKVDGFEKILTSQDFSKITKDVLENVDIKTGQIIGSNNENGKIIENFDCYIAVIMESDRAKQAKENEQVKLRLSNDKEVNAKIVSVQSQEDEVVIVFEVTDSVEELINYRKISIDVIWWSFTGLKVPNNAIIKEGELSYIIRNRVGYTDKILVKILKQNESYTIIDNYKTSELQELGYTLAEIQNMKNINLYDEIQLNNE